MSKNSVLVYCEDPVLGRVLDTYLREEGYQVSNAKGRDDFTNCALGGGYSVLLAEAQTIASEGDPLLHHIVRNLPTQKILLITDFDSLVSCKRALDAGCAHFIAKPVTKADLSLALSDLLNPAPSVELDADDYARIAIEDFIYGSGVPFPIFVRLRDGKFRKVAHTGTNLDLDLIDQLKARGLTELWLERDAFNQYLELTQKRARQAVQQTDGGAAQRARLLAHACEVATENLRLLGVSEQTVETARETLVAAISVIGSGPAVMSLLERIEQQAPTTYNEAACCGVMSGLLAKVMGWVNERNVLTLALGGYLHDVGMYQLPLELREADPKDMSAEELILYRRHPELGVAELSKVGRIPSEVLTIVMQHHENCAGTGFSEQLPAHRIYPMSKAVSLVDAFVRELLRQVPGKRKQGVDLLEDLVSENPAYFDPECVTALRILLTEPDLNRAQQKYSWAAGRTTSKT